MARRSRRIENVNDVVSRSRSTASDMLVFPDKIGTYGMLFMFEDYAYNLDSFSRVASKGSLNESKFSGGVVLPIPVSGFEEKSAISLNEGTLGIEGALVAQLGQGIGEFADLNKLYNALSNNTGTAEGLGALAQVARNSAVGKAAGISAASFVGASGALSGVLSAPGVDKGIDLALGSTANDFKALTFDGVGLRSYSFSWTFYPEKPSDSETIAKITRKFQHAAHPTFDKTLDGFNAGGTAGQVISRAVLKYPKIVKPYILVNESEKYFMQFKPCLIESVNVNYRGDAGVSFLAGGRPTAVSLSITIKEAAIWTAEDYEV